MAGKKALGVMLACLALHACAKRERPLVVGSKNFTEQLVLGEILAQHLEKQLNKPIERKLNLGGTMLAHQAIMSNEIDMYPEYSGTALVAILKLPTDVNPGVVWQRVSDEYKIRFKLEWTLPFGFSNNFVAVIRGEDARKLNISTLSGAEASQHEWRLGAGYEFAERRDGLLALNRSYRLEYSAAPKTMDLGLLYRALEQNQVNMIIANSTDAMLSVMDLKVLEDDRSCFPPYQAGLVVHPSAFEREPGLRAAIDKLRDKCSAETMRKLNYEVDGKKRRPADVAREFLAQAGL